MAFSAGQGNPLGTVVSIPVKSSEDDAEVEFIDINASDVKIEDAMTVLRDEEAQADLWHRVALLYYRAGDIKGFLRIIEEGLKHLETHKLHNSNSLETSVVPLMLSVGSYYFTTALTFEGNNCEQMDKNLAKMTHWYNKANGLGVSGCEAEFYVGRAYIYLLKGDSSNAEKHFTFILETINNRFIPAIVGKGLLAFGRKEYTTALQHFRQALQLDPYSSANVRVGIGHCFWKLGQREKAGLAYKRAVHLYPNDYQALCALATYYLNKMTTEDIKEGMKLVARAFKLCPMHPGSQLFLADHYFYKKEYDKALEFALDVCKMTSSVQIRQRSSYLAGRSYQAKGEYKFAMHYYYQAISESAEAESKLVLPYFGLAQCYLHYNDTQRCSDILLKLLLVEPNNHFGMKILGSIECTSEDLVKRDRAQKYLQAALEQDPSDVDIRLSFATSLECVNDSKAREHYVQSMAAMKKMNLEVLPETYNNYACTLFRLKDYGEAIKYFELALDLITLVVDAGNNNYRPFLTTVNFNRARTREALCDYRSAEIIYKEILKKHPSYFSCYIRLAMVYRSRNILHEADNYFKEAMQCSLDDPDVWAHIGNLHLAQGEILPAQKKFLRIVNLNDSLKRDSYSMIALANIEMHKLFACMNCPNVSIDSQFVQIGKYMKKSLEALQKVLEREPDNIWAAHGVGCIFASKGLFTDAREIFSQVREANLDFKDVCINIAHTYMEQNLYHNAIKMYESCYQRFYTGTDVKILQYLAKAHYYNKTYEEAKVSLLKCLRVAPYDKEILFALGKVLRKLGWKPFGHGGHNLETTMEGLKQLNQAKKIFERLSALKGNTSLLQTAALAEVRHCEDLVHQTAYMMNAKLQEHEYELQVKSKREKEFQELKRKERREQAIMERMRQKKEEEALKSREEVQKKIEKIKKTMGKESIARDSKKRSRKSKKVKKMEGLMDEAFIDDGDQVAVSTDTSTLSAARETPRRPKKSKAKSKKKQETETAGSSITGKRTLINEEDERPFSPVRRKRIKSARLVLNDDSSDSDTQKPTIDNDVIVLSPVEKPANEEVIIASPDTNLANEEVIIASPDEKVVNELNEEVIITPPDKKLADEEIIIVSPDKKLANEEVIISSPDKKLANEEVIISVDEKLANEEVVIASPDKKPAKKRVATSPDITCGHLFLPKGASTSNFASPNESQDSQETGIVSEEAKKIHDENMIFAHIFANGNDISNSPNGEISSEEKMDVNIYSDLPVLTPMHDNIFREFDSDDDDTPPPVLHSIHSDDENYYD